MSSNSIDPWEAQRRAREFKKLVQGINKSILKRGRRAKGKRFIDLRRSQTTQDRFLMDPEGQDLHDRKKNA